ncbi:DUF255 domain-containing protein [Epidermidibacterium keratini]|uniref:DUF255 domain-containing protein n=1 Tax=Epidermidibacterium keratini TaxID=1891644 RepID=A0A7L4YRA0_9ACTN|nr:thioredoxin domain-containing protein [Epidermidibacterium keratini]QHC01309.1 DUF255 domain-containing protein [Epidermidibacterium keratini]
MANRLANSTSPYLQQHADNPVDWRPWGPDAFEEARRRDVPVFISIGYAACHWCHVMAHESFEDPQAAALVNERMVAIKVDREEHPDVDSVYMSATQALTGQGGWPMTVFATPDGEPFYCGTYFPPSPRHGMPSFTQLVSAISDAWVNRRDEVTTSAGEIAEHLRGQHLPVGDALPDSAALAEAVSRLRGAYDQQYGGFGGAPKFPPSTTLLFLLGHLARTDDPAAKEMIDGTLSAMARGGMYDQLAGGFCRYSVDAQWVVPHFEKMLYDNAQLLRDYAYAARFEGRDTDLDRRIAVEIVAFLERDLQTSSGAYASSLDADADGEEGSTYVWTEQQLADVLGNDAAQDASKVFDVTDAGTFEHGTSVLQRHTDADIEPWRGPLLQARARRPQPARDDKVVTSWNALAVIGLAELAETTGEREYADTATRVVTAVLRDNVVGDDDVRRASRDGVTGEARGVLEDYAALALALARLHVLTADRRWLERAKQIADAALERFADGEGYSDAPADHGLVARPSDPLDNPTPSGIALLAEACLTLSAITGESAYAETAERITARLAPLIAGAPQASGTAAWVAEAMVSGPLQVAIGGPAGPERDALERAARQLTDAGRLVIAGDDPQASPLLADRVGERAAAYVCQGSVCQLPAYSPDELAARVADMRRGLGERAR